MTALDTLHDEVAKALTQAVKEGDVRAMTAAINFLKGNNVTADLLESEETKSLFTEIEKQVEDDAVAESVEDMMKNSLKSLRVG